MKGVVVKLTKRSLFGLVAMELSFGCTRIGYSQGVRTGEQDWTEYQGSGGIYCEGEKGSQTENDSNHRGSRGEAKSAFSTRAE